MFGAAASARSPAVSLGVMELAERRIVMGRPGALADGVVRSRSYSDASEGPGIIAGGSFVAYVTSGEGCFDSPTLQGRVRPRTLVWAAAGPLDCDIFTRTHEIVIVGIHDHGPVEAASLTVPLLRHLSAEDGALWYERLCRILRLAEEGALGREEIESLKCELMSLVWLRDAPYAQETLRRVFDFMWERRADAFSLEELAAEFRYTPNYLNDLARLHTGRSLGKWATDIRMATARHLIENTDLPIAEIGASSGYDDPAYFSRAFRRLHGVPPALWRIAHRQEPGVGGLTVSFEQMRRLKEAHAAPSLWQLRPREQLVARSA